MPISPVSKARKAASVLVRDSRDASWARVQSEISPVGIVKSNAGLTDPVGADDFDTGNLGWARDEKEPARVRL